MSNTELNKTFYLTRTFMKLTGVWPESEENNSCSSVKFFVTTSGLTMFILIPQVTKIFYVKNNLNELIDVLSLMLLLMFIAFCKLWNQWLKKKGKN